LSENRSLILFILFRRNKLKNPIQEEEYQDRRDIFKGFLLNDRTIASQKILWRSLGIKKAGGFE
jgi:hypothetical protein